MALSGIITIFQNFLKLQIMPELPEVETTRTGLVRLIVNQVVKNAEIFHPSLRWEIPKHLPKTLKNQSIISIERQAKYLLIHIDSGALIIHLGMSGSLSVVSQDEPRQKHEHFVLNFCNGQSLRLNDPRRFGAVLWQDSDTIHPLLQKLGVEPLTDEFSADYLFNACKGKKRNIKALIMDGKIVVGVGNIYALESLFKAKISPLTPVNTLKKSQISTLVGIIKTILSQAIKQGGTTLKDFSNVDKKAGYFSQQLSVYGRAGKPCLVCSGIISCVKQNNRSSFFCPICQS